MAQKSGYQLFLDQGGASHETVNAWNTANPGKTYSGERDGKPLSYAEWHRFSMLGAPVNAATGQKDTTDYNNAVSASGQPYHQVQQINTYTGTDGTAYTQENPFGGASGGQVGKPQDTNTTPVSTGGDTPATGTSGTGAGGTGLLGTNITTPAGSNGTGGASGSSGTGSTSGNASGNTSGSTGSQYTPIDPTKSAYSKEHLAAMLESNSPYMKAAENNALEQANSRGLLNSSMAVGAAHKAAIEAASPFALQDAQFRQNAELNYQQLQANKELNQQQSDLTIGRGAYDTVANTQGKYLSAIEEITRQATISINEIETAANISPEDKATMIQNTIDRRDADLAWTRQLYSNMPTWDLSWINLTEMPDAPGVV